MRDRPHQRYNPLLREWVLVSPQRLARPWQGRTEEPAAPHRPPYDPTCYLCPGNERAAGVRNPSYATTFVFDNDFPALLEPVPGRWTSDSSRLLRAEPESGACRVICFSPRHDLSVPQLTVEEMGRVVDAWTEEYRDLGARDFIAHVQIFENRGAAMGASNPHPHCQIWATATIPTIPLREQEAQAQHLASTGTCLLCHYAAVEQEEGERLVCANDDFLALVPFWALWPFELLVLPRRHVTGLHEFTAAERAAFAAILKDVTMRYDASFEAACPYSMGIHQRPTDGAPHQEWHVHAHFFPPVLRSASVHKFVVGYELLAAPQRDLTAEAAATRLRNAAVPAAPGVQ